MKTKIISIILSVVIAVTGFTVKSSALDPATLSMIVTAIGKVVIGGLAGTAALSLGDAIAHDLEKISPDLDPVQAMKNWTNYMKNTTCTAAENALNGGVEINYRYDENGKEIYFATANSALTGDDLAFATLLCNKINNSPEFSEHCSNIADNDGSIASGSVTARAYTYLKELIGNATIEFEQNKCYEYAIANGIALENNGAVPIYDFNFVGPIPSIDMPEHYTMATSYTVDGYILTKPYLLTNTSKFSSAAAAENAGCDEVLETADGTAYGIFKFDCTAYSQYVIYNDVIYYYERYNSGISTTASVRGNEIYSGVLSYWKDANGRNLEAAGCTSLIGLYSGFCYTNIPNATSAAPVATVSDDDFITTTGGTTIDIPRTDEEQVIADGIDLGIIDENGNIVLDEEGNIVSIDGLNIDKLMQLIQQIADNGSISFDSVEGYLAEISRLLRLANVDSAAMNTVIANLKELEKSQSKDISEINANVAAIAKALDMSKAEEETEFSGLVVEHTGLVEAGAIINELDIVQQTQGLVNNVLQSYEEGSVNKAPCFKFYWDSNKDGEKEIYDVLDLSFLDTTLTNENLVDKDRLKTPVTARYFIHCLMIFICYTFFAIKILKKLPSLFGGSDDDFDEFKVIKNG